MSSNSLSIDMAQATTDTPSQLPLTALYPAAKCVQNGLRSANLRGKSAFEFERYALVRHSIFFFSIRTTDFWVCSVISPSWVVQIGRASCRERVCQYV